MGVWRQRMLSVVILSEYREMELCFATCFSLVMASPLLSLVDARFERAKH